MLRFLLLLAAAFRPRPARPAGRHAAGLVVLVPADYNPLPDRIRTNIARYATAARMTREEVAA